MTTEPIDTPLLELTDPALARPLHPGIPGARADVIAAARDLLTIPEAALARDWAWIGGSETEIRYGAYRAAEALEAAEIEARVLVSGTIAQEPRAALLVGPATAARWDLYGLLLPLDDATLDADPGGGEWSIRLVMGHIISGQRGYGWGTAWWQAQGFSVTDPDLASGAPESFWAPQPDEATTEAAGTVDDLRDRLDAILDLSSERLAGLPDERIAFGSRWSGFPVPVGFRIARWASHVREHSIQIEKTFALLRYAPNEPARLARNLLAAYGRAESVVFGRVGVDAAVERVVAGAAEARQVVASARDSAEG